MLITRFYMNYFAVEVLFGVQNHFGKSSDDAVREIAQVLRQGMVAAVAGRPESQTPATAGVASRVRAVEDVAAGLQPGHHD